MLQSTIAFLENCIAAVFRVISPHLRRLSFKEAYALTAGYIIGITLQTSLITTPLVIAFLLLVFFTFWPDAGPDLQITVIQN